MIRVTLVKNLFEKEQDTTVHEVEDILTFLKSQWDVFPDNATIYHESIDKDHNVTPKNEEQFQKLMELQGNLYVVVYPQGPTVLFAAFLFGALVVAFTLKPEVPPVPAAARNQSSGSPNNELVSRSNQARPNGRIPDIFGEQISTPDLIAVPYSIYENHRELRYDYMCIGRGEYSIDLADIKDGETRLIDIEDTAVEVYGPNTSPNYGTPQLNIGSIDEPVMFVQKSNSVNGQVLLPPNTAVLVSAGHMGVHSSGYLVHDGTGGFDFNTYFDVGDTVNLLIEPVPDGILFFQGWINLSGYYEITAITSTTLTFGDIHSVSEGWATFQASSYWNASPRNGLCPPDLVEMTLELVNQENWVGPFTLDNASLTSIISNYVAPQGMYLDNGTDQFSTEVQIQTEILRVNNQNVAIDLPEYFVTTIVGSNILRTQRSVTQRPAPVPRGRMQVRSRRLTVRDTSFSGQVVDEVRWKDLYGTYVVEQEHFGNVTTIQSKTYATDGALAVKDSKLNMRVVRKINVASATPTTHTLSPLAPSKRAVDILIFMALDPYIGGRTESELNFYELVQTQLSVEGYFGTPKAGEFCYTFDKANISFEESIASVADACFSVAYRRGHVITTAFERPVDRSKLSFGHRNKTPGSEQRSYTFGTDGDIDGIEYDYIEEFDQSPQTYYIPEDRSAANPRKIESIGIRNKLQAYFHAHRRYNKIIKQKIAVEFEATQEAALLVKNDKILVADNTRPNTQDGQIVEKSGLTIRTSQPVKFEDDFDYTVFVQLTDGTVQPIPATAGVDQYHIVLSEEPDLALSLNPSNARVSTYVLVRGDDPRIISFLTLERVTSGKFRHTVRAINYDEAYYAKDRDYAEREIDDNLNPVGVTDGAEWSGVIFSPTVDGQVFNGVRYVDPPWYAGAPIPFLGNDYWVKLVRASGTPGADIASSGGPITETPWTRINTNPGFTAGGPSGGFVRCQCLISDTADGSGEVWENVAVLTIP